MIPQPRLTADDLLILQIRRHQPEAGPHPHPGFLPAFFAAALCWLLARVTI
jgi:hypothetical protein